VRFDPWDAGEDADATGEGDVGEIGEDVGPDGEADVPVEDGFEADGDAGDGEDVGGVCGDGTLDPGEECDGDEPLPCTTGCSTAGLRYCVDCAWLPCATSDLEVCNAADDDCDGLTDEIFPCVRGVEVDCVTLCGTAGRSSCSDDCQIPDPADCPVPDDVCNGVDDDCDTVADGGFDCVAGEVLSCTTSCGSTGSGFCSPLCERPGPAACPLPAESCNGVDDDCDTLVDEDLWRVTGTNRITNGATPSKRPSAAYLSAGSVRQYAVAWQEEDPSTPNRGRILLTRLLRTGARAVPADTTVSTGTSGPFTDFSEPSVASVDSGWGVAYAGWAGTNVEILFTPVGATGTAGAEVRITDDTAQSREPMLVGARTEFAVVWSDAPTSNIETYFIRLGATGIPRSSQIRLAETPTCVSMRPQAAFTGSEYGVAWQEWCGSDGGDVSFSRVDAAGAEIAGAERTVVLTPAGASTYPRIAWNGTHYGLAWLDDRDGTGTDHPYFQRIEGTGVPAGSPRRLIPVTAWSGAAPYMPPTILWSETRREFLVAWSDQEFAATLCTGGTCGTEIVAQRLTPEGTPIGAPIRVTAAPGESSWPVVAEDGTAVVLVWSDARHAAGGDGNFEIYSARIACE
jgi:hypothetical protein